MGRRNDHSRDELREMALRAAESIIVDRGIEGLSARRVAAGIGYTVGSLYLVFRNLDDLILQLNTRTLTELCEHLSRAAAAHVEPRTCLRAMGQAYIDFAVTNRNRWSLVFHHRPPPELPPPQAFGDAVATMFALVYAQLHALDPQRSADDIQDAAHALWSGVHGIATLGLDRKLQAGMSAGTEEAVARTAVSLVEHYLAGYCAAGSGSVRTGS